MGIRANRIAGSSVISLLAATHPASVSSSIRALSNALGGSSSVTFLARAEVTSSDLLVAVDILVGALATFVFGTRAEI